MHQARTRKAVALLALATILLTVAPAAALAKEPAIDHREGADENQALSLLLVASASSGMVEGDMLRLEGVPSVTYFSDRPARVSGHFSIEQLAAGWAAGSDSFAENPPNAVLSMLDPEVPQNAVVELTSIEVDGDDLLVGFRALEGGLPAGAFAQASLFIDDEDADMEAVSLEDLLNIQQ